MLAQTEITYQIDLANASYDNNNAASPRYLADDVLRTNYVAGWLTSAFKVDITEALTLVDSYLVELEAIAYEAELAFDDEYQAWLTSTLTGIPMS